MEEPCSFKNIISKICKYYSRGELNLKVEMQHMTWQDFANVKDKAVLILPVGSLEQHGPHLPLGTDVYITYNLSLLLAKEVEGIVAPPINYGYKSLPASGGGPLFPGTVDLNGNTLMLLVKDIIEELIRDGVKKIFVMNGHFENEAFILEAVDLVMKQKAHDVKIMVASWWNQVSKEVLDKIFDEVTFPGWELEHAAIAETSLVLNFAPEMVRMERLIEDGIDTPPTYHIYPVPEGLVPASGLLHTARTCSREKGAMLAQEITERLAEIVRRNF